MRNTDRKTVKSIDVMLVNDELFSYSVGVVAKSTASREKLNEYQANSTPFNHRAFFVRNFRTPKENQFSQMVKMALHSMVGRNGQSSTIGYFPDMVVSHPVTLYRQTVRSLAVVPKNLISGLSTMNTYNPPILANFIAKISSKTTACKGGIYA